MASWSLLDVEESARQYPRSFFIPEFAERCSQSVGDRVRLHFAVAAEGPDLPSAERMWVDIVQKDGDPPTYLGELINRPVHISDLHAGDRITFGPQHIAQTIIKESDPRWYEAAELSALVSRKVLEDGQEVRWMYRVTADRDDDSGWRLFCGDETDEYANDVSNVRICSVGWLVDRDPTLLPAIRGDVGSAFERASGSEPWVAVRDWESPEE